VTQLKQYLDLFSLWTLWISSSCCKPCDGHACVKYWSCHQSGHKIDSINWQKKKEEEEKEIVYLFGCEFLRGVGIVVFSVRHWCSS